MLISVIVPIYNAEKTLKRCIESVMVQTYTNWELLLVDDGSTDSTSDIIRAYEERDSRIKSIQQENCGPGTARNSGIQESKGDYVVFLDADDYIDPDYFQLLQLKAKTADVVFVDVLQIDSYGKRLRKERMSQYKNQSKESFQRAMMTGKIPWGGVRKAVRLDLIKANDIQFSALNIGEESLYSFKLFEVAKKIDFIDKKPVYMYVNHEGSQSKLMVDDPWGATVKLLKQYLSEDKKRYENFADTLNAFNAAATIVSIDRITQLYHGKERKEKIKNRMSEYRKMVDPSFEIDKKSLMLKAKVLLPFLRSGMAAPIVFCSKFRRMIKH